MNPIKVQKKGEKKKKKTTLTFLEKQWSQTG